MNFLREQLATDSKSRIAYFFCNDKDVYNRTAVAVLKSLLYQLLHQNPGFFQHILPEYEKFRLDKETNWSAAALWSAFHNIVIDPAAESVYCVVDALDECLDDQGGNDYRRSDLLRDLHDLYLSQSSSQCTARIVLSSRPLPAIQSLLPNISLVIRLEDFNRSDIGQYISDEVDRLAIKGKYPPGLKVEVQKTIEEMSGNMFLWVSLTVNDLSKRRTIKEIRHLLNTVPRTLFAYYECILASISSENSDRAKVLLMWIAHAATPIRLEELALAIAVRDDARSIAEIEEDMPLNIEDHIMELCSPLVEIVDTYVVFIHQSVKDFLMTAGERVGLDSPPFEPRYHRIYHVPLQEASSKLTRTCITYLTFIDHTQRPPAIDVSECPVLGWPIHARLSAPLDDKTKHVFPKFLDINSAHFSVWMKYYWDLHLAGESFEGEIQSHIQPLYVASLLHITPLVKLLLEDGADVNNQGGTYINALQCAASNGGSIDIVEILVGEGADVNAYGGFHGTALMAASFSGNIEVVKFLLVCGAKTDLVGGKFGDVLQAAAWRENLDIIKLLLDSGASINVLGGEFGNPLLAAAWSGHPDVAEFLLDQGLDANNRGRLNGFPLQAAVRRGHTIVIQKLL
jgi:ankyrin repeat protein